MTWLLALLLSSAPEPLPLVAIDAGHGGRQGGATGVCGVQEKDVALAVSKELAALLETSGRAHVLMTRTGDEEVELEERARSANVAGAALFVSVHANASVNDETRGIETYFLSNRSANRRIAKLASRENDGVVLAPQAEDDDLQAILTRLALNASHTGSQRLAKRLQEGMNTSLDTRGRGVLQAPFIVLLGAQMPAALVEVGFLTNEEECRSLASQAYQRDIARILAAAILEHLTNEKTRLARR